MGVVSWVTCLINSTADDVRICIREQKSRALERGAIAAVDSWVKHRKCNDGEHDVVLMRLLFLTPCSQARVQTKNPDRTSWGESGVYILGFIFVKVVQPVRTHSTLLSYLDCVQRTATQVFSVVVDQLLSAPRLQSSSLRCFESKLFYIIGKITYNHYTIFNLK